MIESRAPVYSHVVYDIVDDEHVVIEQPDIVILEGLNVLQTGEAATEFVSDYFDFSIYIDAAESDIEQWYVERFLTLREVSFPGPPTASSGTTPNLPTSRQSKPPATSGARSTVEICARTSRRHATGLHSSCGSARIIVSIACNSCGYSASIERDVGRPIAE